MVVMRLENDKITPVEPLPVLMEPMDVSLADRAEILEL